MSEPERSQCLTAFVRHSLGDMSAVMERIRKIRNITDANQATMVAALQKRIQELSPHPAGQVPQNEPPLQAAAVQAAGNRQGRRGTQSAALKNGRGRKLCSNASSLPLVLRFRTSRRPRKCAILALLLWTPLLLLSAGLTSKLP